MSQVHHQYRGFHIVYQSSINAYRVLHDDTPSLSDPHLRIANLRSAKAFVDALWVNLLEPILEPAQSLRLEPWYRSGFRDNGSRTSLFFVSQPPQPNTCAHVFCTVAQASATGNAWRYCGATPLRGSTRCQTHSATPGTVSTAQLHADEHGKFPPVPPNLR